MFPKKKIDNNIMFGRNTFQNKKDKIEIISNTLNLSSSLNSKFNDSKIPSKKNR